MRQVSICIECVKVEKGVTSATSLRAKHLVRYIGGNRGVTSEDWGKRKRGFAIEAMPGGLYRAGDAAAGK